MANKSREVSNRHAQVQRVCNNTQCKGNPKTGSKVFYTSNQVGAHKCPYCGKAI